VISLKGGNANVMSFLETVVCKFVDLVVAFVDFGVLFDKVHFAVDSVN